MRDFWRSRKTRLALTFVATLSLSVGCGGTDGGSGANDKAAPVKVGIVEQPPYSSQDKSTGAGTGVCPQLITAAFTAAGRPEPTYIVASAYSDLISGLQAKRWDMVGACLQITAERCQQVAFTDPLETETFSLAVPNGNPKQIASLGQFGKGGLKLGLLRGSTTNAKAKALGVPESAISLYPSVRDLIDAVNAGRVDAAFAGGQSLQGIAAEGVTFLAASDVVLQPAAAAFRKDDKELMDVFSRGLKTIKDNGKYKSISESNGFDPKITINVTAEQACTAR
ncbi:transporter substrate-binding domain-containing protein [Dactylosporangium sp. NPDC000555]|uniref:transporter substrate-binding domain-containing protein n=1 Tax=Dactylosporangium sp. NPDC000555 TaxID=3154260 RepID=UPI00332FF8A7